MTRVTVVDDHRVVAEGMARLIAEQPGYEVVAIVGSGEEFLASLRQFPPPDVCVLDLSMPGIGGADVLRTLQAEYPSVRTLVVSAAARPEIAARCLREGAVGFLSKFNSSDDLLDAVRTVAEGRRFIDHELFSAVLDHLASATKGERSADDLSSREFTVMQKLAEGHSVKDISTEMNLSTKTVSTYRARVMKKLNFSSNAEIVAYCLQHGIVSIDTAP